MNSFFADSPGSSRVSWIAIDEGGVLNQVTRANQLTRGKLMKQDDWTDWESSEFLQLDQYEKQMMFGTPVTVTSQSSVFNLVWSYDIKVEDSRKKARCTCDGSTRAGQVRVLDHTYAHWVDHTSGRLFYGIAAVENLVIHGSDVSNAFGEAPHRNRVSSSVQTEYSETCGIRVVVNQSQRALSSLCNVQCKVTLRHRVFGRNISTKSCANWD